MPSKMEKKGGKRSRVSKGINDHNTQKHIRVSHNKKKKENGNLHGAV